MRQRLRDDANQEEKMHDSHSNSHSLYLYLIYLSLCIYLYLSICLSLSATLYPPSSNLYLSNSTSHHSTAQRSTKTARHNKQYSLSLHKRLAPVRARAGAAHTAALASPWRTAATRVPARVCAQRSRHGGWWCGRVRQKRGRNTVGGLSKARLFDLTILVMKPVHSLLILEPEHRVLFWRSNIE
jgi:hypothetical protein